MRTQHSELDDPLDVLASQSDAASAIDAWLAVFARLMHLPEPVRQSIRAELREHLRERVRDLLLSGGANVDERDAVRIAIEELGETAQLARRFEAANTPKSRRRTLMHATLLLAGAGVIAAGVVTFNTNNNNPNTSPAPAPGMIASACFGEANAEPADAPPKSFTEAKVTLAADTRLRDAVEAVATQAKVGLTVDWDEIQQAEIDPEGLLGLSLTEVPAPAALSRIAEAAGGGEWPNTLDWRPREGGIEFGVRHKLDAREIELITYDITSTIAIIGDQFCESREQAAEQVAQLLHAMVDPELWRDNGGDLAHMSLVGGRLFVQAPARMQTKVKWVLDQLPGEEKQARGAPAHGDAPGVPVLKDVPILNRVFSAPAEDSSTLEQRFNDATTKFNAFKDRYKPGTLMYDTAAKELQAAEQALRSAQQATDANDPQVIRQRYEQAQDIRHFARLKYTAGSPEYLAAEEQLRAAQQALQATMLLRPGDVLHMEVFDLERHGEWFRTSRQIEADGIVRFPIVGEFNAAGRAAREVEQDIVASLSKTNMANPVVSVYQFDAATLRAMSEQHARKSDARTPATGDLPMVEAPNRDPK
jgi:hypothetical protein